MTEELTPRSSLPDGARCAIHPDLSAERTCVRCGNYMCAQCTSAGGADAASAICLTCASRVGESGAFPYSREHYDLNGLLNLSLSRWKKHWLLLALVFGAALVTVYGTSAAGEYVFARMADAEPEGELPSLRSLFHPARLAMQVAASALQTLIQLLFLGLCVDILQNRPPSWQAARERLRALPASLLQLAMFYAAIAAYGGVGYLLFIVSGGLEGGVVMFMVLLSAVLISIPVLFYVSLGLMFSSLVLAADPSEGAWSAIVRSWRTVEGHRVSAAGVASVAGLITVAGAILCCVGLLGSAPMGTLLYVGFYLALDNRASRRQHAGVEEWGV